MSAVLKSITPAEYLARERQADFKSEYFQGEVFAMSGGSANHSLIAANFLGEARQSLKGKPCTVYSSDLRMKVAATGLMTYPDVSIVCGEIEYDDEVRDTVLNPSVIVEVLSESTEKFDRGRKASHYRQIPSLKELVLISQTDPCVERYIRQEGEGWLLLEEKGLANSVIYESVGVTIPMSEIYRGVEFKAETDPALSSMRPLQQ